MWDGRPVSEKLVLVVDDERCVRGAMSRLLGMNGYSVLEAENGQQALELLEKTPHLPSVILLDLTMPIMDGYGFLKIRAGEPMLRRIPVIVVSGNATSGQLLDGIDAYLHKPLKVDHLLKVIRTTSG
jgi:CheY-like chemotaxis protein